MDPNYFAIIPAKVRYNKNISYFAKILFSEISALSNKDGYCSASNGYFAGLYNCSESTVSETISSLNKEGFVLIRIYKQYKRKIWPLVDPLPEKPKGGTRKAEGGVPEKAEENNTSYNNKYNTGSIRIERDSDKPLREKKDTSYFSVFDLWGDYPLHWKKNTTEISAAKNILEESTLEYAKTMLKMYDRLKDFPYCPSILKPSDLDRKWDNLLAFKKKHG